VNFNYKASINIYGVCSVNVNKMSAADMDKLQSKLLKIAVGVYKFSKILLC
jgi:hypothetical protein